MNAKRERGLFVGLAFMMVAVWITIAFAIPSQPHNLYGTVKDATGAIMANATITVTLNAGTTAAKIKDNNSGAVGTSAKSDSTGYYDLDILIYIDKPGRAANPSTRTYPYLCTESKETKAGN
jgi:hypothetical protein